MNSGGYSAPSYAQNSFPTTTGESENLPTTTGESENLPTTTGESENLPTTTTGESENRPPDKGSNSSSYLSNSRHLDRDKMDEEPALDTNSKIEFEKHNVL